MIHVEVCHEQQVDVFKVAHVEERQCILTLRKHNPFQRANDVPVASSTDLALSVKPTIEHDITASVLQDNAAPPDLLPPSDRENLHFVLWAFRWV